jgi:electron transport complex protein RnfB
MMRADAPPATAELIDRVLPQTQCTKCGFDGCRPYAEAIAAGTAAINRCPPGGRAGIRELAALTGQPEIALDPACGVERPRRVAWIDAERCIGCTKCIQACPTDAIIGAPKWLHGVLTEHCTGCDLCVPPCPVDCIDMRELPDGTSSWSRQEADRARDRYHARAQRLVREQRRNEDRLASLALGKLAALAGHDDAASQRKRAVVEAAIARARSRRAARDAGSVGAHAAPGGKGER